MSAESTLGTLPSDYQNFIHISRYSRWRDDVKRRETWPETVDRYLDFIENHLQHNNNFEITPILKDELRTAILTLEIMPSMRAMMTAGPALARNNVAGYNCSYIPVDSPRSFDEAMYILMCGTGVGFSVENQYVSQLPIISEDFNYSATTIKVADSKEGWCKSLKELVSLLYSGEIPNWDVSMVRPAGARLKTFGGRASGPGPLVDLFEFTVKTFQKAAGRKLTALECHDIMCKIGEVVVVGGVRRSAMISLSDLDDSEMQSAKSGEWWERNGHRRLANNSVAYSGRPNIETFESEWKSLYDSKSGERGIFNRVAAMVQASKSRRREIFDAFGTNPCSEIILKPFQFCNLTEVVCRSYDTLESLARKVELATILGTFQSTLVNFKYLRKIWKKNTEEERLLGVSLTGITDCHILCNGSGENIRRQLLENAVATNAAFADMIGIQASAAITCVKPSGTVSQLVDAASGIHPRYSPYYIRRVRGDVKDPMSRFMRDMGVPHEPDVTSPDNTVIFSFPVKAPEGALTREDISAIEHLELWKKFQDEWCEHKPSITITVKDHEWDEVKDWVWENFDIISGISFLPYDGGTYVQAPYESISEIEYNSLVERMPSKIDWTVLTEYETEDNTAGSQTLACSGDSCEIVDLVA